MTLVKVCGMTREEDVDAAVDAGADMVGFILVPWSPRGVDVDRARALGARLPAGIEAVAVVSDDTAEEAERALAASGADRVQVYGPHAEEVARRLGERAIAARRLPADDPGDADPVLLDRAFHDEPTESELADHWAAAAALGASGRRVLLAGALDPGNVARAVAAARPWAVDVARGVEERPGIKDHARIAAFIAAARDGGAA